MTSIVLMVTLGAAVIGLQMVRDARFPEAAAGQQVLYVTSPSVATRMVLSYHALAADIYWIRTLQYYGRTRLAAGDEKQYPLLFPLLDLTTSLDPAFSLAYRFGAFFLSEPQPGGAGQPERALQLLEKGMRASPERWEYLYDVGFIHYRDGDYDRAGHWFGRAHDVPGAPPWLGPLAAVTLATGGNIASSRLIWRQMLETAEEPWLRASAEHRLLQLDAVEAIEHLERMLAAYAARQGHAARDWANLVRAGVLRGIPQDPAGHPYLLEPPGRVTVSRESPLWPLPIHGAR